MDLVADVAKTFEELPGHHYNRDSCGFGQGVCKPGPQGSFLHEISWDKRVPSLGSCLKDGKYSNDADQGDTSPGGRGGYFQRLLARQAAGPPGPWGDPDVVSFQFTASQNGRGGIHGGRKEEPRGPQGLLRSSQGGGGASVPQVVSFREQNGSHGGASQRQPTGATLQASLLQKQAPGGCGGDPSGQRKRWECARERDVRPGKDGRACPPGPSLCPPARGHQKHLKPRPPGNFRPRTRTEGSPFTETLVFHQNQRVSVLEGP